MPYGTINADLLTTSSGQSLGAGNATGFKNRIINGAMGIWQRGTSGFTTSGNYCADRFYVSGTLTTVAQSSDVPSSSPFRYSLNVAGSSSPACYQKIESYNSQDLVGQSVTLSFWWKQTAGAGSGTLAVGLFCPTSQDNFSLTTQIGSYSYLTPTSSWAQYSVTFTSLPANVANGLLVSISSIAAGSSTFYITGVQLEVGSTASSFDVRSYGTELYLCQRYYETSGTASNYGSNLCVANDTSRAACASAFTVPKRANPTCAIYSSSGVNTVVMPGVQSVTLSGVSYFIGGIMFVDSSSAFVAGRPYVFYYTASAEL